MAPDQPSDPSKEEVRARLQQHFQRYSGDKYGEGWSELWDQGGSLPWDRGVPNPALVDTLKERQDVIGDAMIRDGDTVRRKKALVPGCGRGYDVLLLRSFGYDAVGLEYSKAAVQACYDFQEAHSHEYPRRDEKVEEGSAKFVVGDFFKDDWRGEESEVTVKFDLIYDYTFFCALNPSLRPQWARRMSELLSAGPNANLICLEFPTYKPPSTGGPPFSSPSEAYDAHLTHPGEHVPYDDQGRVDSGALKEPTDHALVQCARWTPKRSHTISIDDSGNVRDFVAVWRHP